MTAIGEKRIMPIGHEVTCTGVSPNYVAYVSALAPEERVVPISTWEGWELVEGET